MSAPMSAPEPQQEGAEYYYNPDIHHQYDPQMQHLALLKNEGEAVAQAAQQPVQVHPDAQGYLVHPQSGEERLGDGDDEMPDSKRIKLKCADPECAKDGHRHCHNKSGLKYCAACCRKNGGCSRHKLPTDGDEAGPVTSLVTIAPPLVYELLANSLAAVSAPADANQAARAAVAETPGKIPCASPECPNPGHNHCHNRTGLKYCASCCRKYGGCARHKIQIPGGPATYAGQYGDPMLGGAGSGPTPGKMPCSNPECSKDGHQHCHNKSGNKYCAACCRKFGGCARHKIPGEVPPEPTSLGKIPCANNECPKGGHQHCYNKSGLKYCAACCRKFGGCSRHKMTDPTGVAYLPEELMHQMGPPQGMSVPSMMPPATDMMQSLPPPQAV